MTETTVEQGKDEPRPETVEESTSGDTDLDTLLTEFDTAKPEKKPEPQPVQVPDQALARTLKALKPVIEYVEDEKSQRLAKAHETALEQAFDYMREPEEFKDFPNRWLIGYFEAYGGENGDFAKAFENRQKAPKEWDTQLAKAREALPEWLKEIPGNTVRSDIEAASAAVNGTTQEAAEPEGPSPAEKASMSDVEWKRYMQEQLAAG